MKQLESDVVVISAGTAGLAAAVSAAEGGASVVAFEKAATTGGTGKMAGGVFAVESRLQRLKQFTLTREEAFKLYMDYTHWRVNARLVKTFIDKSASTFGWLEDMGVEFVDIASHNPGFNYTHHIVKGPTPHQLNGAAMMKILADRAEGLEVRIFLKTPAKRILKEGGRIAGAVAEDESGEEIQANARAVILATGGYFVGSLPGVPVAGGDGIRMAREVGAATKEIEVPDRGGLPGAPRRMYFSIMYTFGQPGLMVNLLGERFMNEEIVVNTFFGGNAIARQKDGTCFTIFDEETKKQYVEKGWDFAPGGIQVTPMTKATNFDVDFREALDGGDKSIFVADSLEELASKTGINLDGLRKTVDEYNKACETGRDVLFDKRARYLRPVKQPKFYASKRVSGDMRDWGGIKINYKTEVLTKDYEVILGLYATGMDTACEIYDGTYPFILPATAMGFAINSGRVAAESALEYIKSIGK